MVETFNRKVEFHTRATARLEAKLEAGKKVLERLIAEKETKSERLAELEALLADYKARYGDLEKK